MFVQFADLRHLQSIHERIQEWLDEKKIERQDGPQHTGNTAHIKPALKDLKAAAEREVEKRDQVRRAGADGLLPRLLTARKTHLKNFHIGEKDGNQRNHHSQDDTEQPIDVVDSGVGARQLHYKVVVTVQTIDDVSAES